MNPKAHDESILLLDPNADDETTPLIATQSQPSEGSLTGAYHQWSDYLLKLCHPYQQHAQCLHEVGVYYGKKILDFEVANIKVMQQILSSAYSVKVFIFSVYTFMYVIGFAECEYDYKNYMTLIALFASVVLSYPNTYIQMQTMPRFFNSLIYPEASTVATVNTTNKNIEKIWELYATTANKLSFFAVGWSAASTITRLGETTQQQSLVDCLYQELTNGSSYLYKLLGASIQWLLLTSHINYYLGSTATKAQVPLLLKYKLFKNPETVFSLYGFCYALAMFIQTLPSILISFSQTYHKDKSDESQQAFVHDPIFINMFIKLLISLVLSLPLRWMNRKSTFLSNHKRARQTLQLENVYAQSPVGLITSDLPDHYNYLKALFKAFVTAGISGYSYYLSALGLIAVLNKLFPGSAEEPYKIPVEVLSILTSTCAGLASWLRYVRFYVQKNNEYKTTWEHHDGEA